MGARTGAGTPPGRPARSGDCLFIQFAREPVAGAVKTRMSPHLTPAAACELHSELVLWTASTLVRTGLGPVELAVAGAVGHPLFSRCLQLGVARVGLQQGVDLGERMYQALSAGLRRFARVVLVGSDCPGIDRAYLRAALRVLDHSEVVLGPALDGGYVLIGARRIEREIFTGVSWGTSAVYAQTLARLRGRGITPGELPPLADIDRPEDLPVWEALRCGSAPAGRSSGAGQLPG